jgi:hypothetical protein
MRTPTGFDITGLEAKMANDEDADAWMRKETVLGLI